MNVNPIEKCCIIRKNEKTLIRIIDVLGRKATPTYNAPLFYIYNDGTVEKKLIVQ